MKLLVILSLACAALASRNSCVKLKTCDPKWEHKCNHMKPPHTCFVNRHGKLACKKVSDIIHHFKKASERRARNVCCRNAGYGKYSFFSNCACNARTCDNNNPTCNWRNCEQDPGCYCRKGYVLQDGECVPASTCPVPPKPGYCPDPRQVFTSVHGKCYMPGMEQCQFDADCFGDLKCCQNGDNCGKACVKPSYDNCDDFQEANGHCPEHRPCRVVFDTAQCDKDFFLQFKEGKHPRVKKCPKVHGPPVASTSVCQEGYGLDHNGCTTDEHICPCHPFPKGKCGDRIWNKCVPDFEEGGSFTCERRRCHEENPLEAIEAIRPCPAHRPVCVDPVDVESDGKSYCTVSNGPPS